MIKGVCKQIVEINDTESDYFERALFFVNPGFSEIERTALEREARRILHRMSAPTRAQSRRRSLYFWVRMACSALVGIVLGVLVGIFFFGGV